MNKFIKSFHYASDGIVYSIATQRNMKIHVAISLVVLLLGMWLHFHLDDIITILLLISVVLAAEMFNTAIETGIDLITKEVHPLAKIAKDTAAGAVLILAIVAVLVGLGVIGPYLFQFYLNHWQVTTSASQGFYLLAANFLILITFVVKSYWTRKKGVQATPSILIGMLMIFFSYLWIVIPIISIVFLIAIIVPYLVVSFKQEYSIMGLLQNSLISIAGFYLLVLCFY